MFSLYIRRSHADKKGNCKCVTCGCIKPIEDMQAGHFLDGRNNSILFDERGVHPQCYACNCCLHGNKVEYFKWMEKNYGRGVIDELCILKNSPMKLDYQQIIDTYKTKLEAIK